MKEKHVEFVSYTGEYPCLCSGDLTLKIDGLTYTFGDDCPDEYETFWESGGSCFWEANDDEDEVECAKWIIHKDQLPPKFQPYTDEIAEIFNENVPYGCCGGCI